MRRNIDLCAHRQVEVPATEISVSLILYWHGGGGGQSGNNNKSMCKVVVKAGPGGG